MLDERINDSVGSNTRK